MKKDCKSKKKHSCLLVSESKKINIELTMLRDKFTFEKEKHRKQIRLIFS